MDINAFSQYSSIARTYNFYRERIGEGLDLAYITLGLAGEAGELISEKGREEIKLELGDIMWYINEFCLKLGVPLTNMIGEAYALPPQSEKDGTVQMLICSAAITNVVKKVYRDGQGEINEYQKKLILDNLVAIGSIWLDEAEAAGLAIEEILVSNLEKLEKRTG